MSGQSWVVYVLRLLISWLRQRIAALAAKIESSRGRKPDAVSSATSAQSAALPTQESDSPGEPADHSESEEMTLAARHFPSEAAATEEEAVETVEGVASERVDPLDLSANTKWPIGQSPSFTPDASLDLVEDIEFAFEPKADTEDTTDASRGWVQGDGTRECPELYPIKGNGTSHIYHLPGQASYAATIPERCFATEQDAQENGFRPTKRNRVSS